MASTGEPLTVNSDTATSVSNKFNQICGIKKGLENVIADPRKSYEDKFGSMVSSWDCLSNFASSKQLLPAHQSNITSLVKWIYPITLKLVINTSWNKLRNISKVTISHALRRCRALLKAQEDIKILETLQVLIKGPWDNPILVKLFDKNKLNIDHVTDREVLEYCNNEGAMTLALRLEELNVSHCDRLCGNLSDACMRSLALNGCNLGELGVDGDKQYIHLIIDIRVAILVRGGQLKRVLGQFNKIGLNEVQKLVYRFRARQPPVSSGELNLWSCSNDVVTVALEHCITKAMVAPVNDVEEAMSIFTMWVEQHAHLQDGFKSVADNIYKSAASSRHVFLFADAVKKEFGSKYPQLYIEYYLRGLTMTFNELEYLKSFQVKNLDLIREMEIRMADGFIMLADLAKVNDIVYRECFLTAFSLNPTKECLEILKRIGEQRHRSDPMAGVTRPHVCIPPEDRSDSRVSDNDVSDTANKVVVDSSASGDSESGVDVGRPTDSVESENHSTGAKAGVLCSRCGSFLPEEVSQSKSSWLFVAVDNKGLELSDQQLDDLVVVLSSPRWRLLSWTFSWPELEKACELYLLNAPLRNTEKELTFLNKNIDYDQFDCWKYPKVCEDEYAGIEKGYENCLLAEDDEEEEEIEEPIRKPKTLKKQSVFVDSDSSADRRKKARRKWKKTEDMDYKVRPRAKPRVTKKRNLFLSSVSEYETTTQDSVRTEGNSDTYSPSPVEMDRSPSTRKMDMVLDCPLLKLPPSPFVYDENGERFATIVESKRSSDPKTLKKLRMFRNPAKKQSPEKKEKDFNFKYAPMLSTIDLNPRVLLDPTEVLSPVKKQPHPKNGRASLENCSPPLDRISAAASPASAKARPVMGLDFLSSVLLTKDRLGMEEGLDDRQLMKAHIPGLATLDMIVPLAAETSVHMVQLPQSVASTGGGQGAGQSVPPPKPTTQTSTPPALPVTQPPVPVTPSRAVRDRVNITSILQSQPGLSYANRSGQVVPVSKASNETVTSETAKPSEEAVAPPSEATLSQADANESLPKFHQAFTKTSRVLYCQSGNAVATTSQEAAAPSEDAPQAASSSQGIAAGKEGLAAQTQGNPPGQVRQPLHVHVTPIRPTGHIVQPGTGQIRQPGQVVQIGPSRQLRQSSVVQLGSTGQMKQPGQILQVSPAGQISRSIQMTQVVQSSHPSANPLGQISAAGLIAQASQVISGQITQANQPGQSTASIGNLNLVMSMPPILRVVQNPAVYINQISSAAKTSFLAAPGDVTTPAMSIVLSKESRPGFVNRSTAAPPESSSDDDASMPKPPNFSSTASDEMGTSAGDLSTSTYEQLQEFESVLKQVKEKGEIQGDVTSPIAPAAVAHTVQTSAMPCGKVPMSRIPSTSSVMAVNALKTASVKGTKLLMVTTNCPSLSAPATPTAASPGKTLPKSGKTSKPKSAKTSPTSATAVAAAATAAKASPIAKPQQKPQEDEQTTQRIYDILNQYAEQLRNSPDLNNKPAPRRRSNPPTNPGPSKRKKSTAKAKSTTAEMSPGVDDPAADEDDSSSTTLIHMGGVHDSPAPSQQSADEGQSQSVSASLEASSEGGNLKSVVTDPNESNKDKIVDVEANASPAGSKPMLVASSSGTNRFVVNSNIRALLMQSFMKGPGKVIHVMNGPGRGPNMQIVVRHAAPTKAQGLASLCGGGGGYQRLDHDSITLGLSPIRSSSATASNSITTSTPLPSASPLEAVQACRRDLFQCGGMDVIKEMPHMFVEAVAVSSASVAVIRPPAEKEETEVVSPSPKFSLVDEAVPDRVVAEVRAENGTVKHFPGQEISACEVTGESQADLEVDSASTELSEAQKMFECAEKESEEDDDGEENIDQEDIEEDDNTESEILDSKSAGTSKSGAAVSKPETSNQEGVSFLAGIIDPNPKGTKDLTAGIQLKLTSMLSGPVRTAPKATDGSSDDDAAPFTHRDPAAEHGFSGHPDGAPKHFHASKAELAQPILSKNPVEVGIVQGSGRELRKYQRKRPVADCATNTFTRKVVIALRANSRPCNAQPLLKSLSEECEDLGVDRPSTNDLFPETLLMMDADTSSSPGLEMAAVVPCPIDLNKHVPMFSGVTIGENIEIASNVEIESNVEIGSNVEIDSNVEMDTSMEIASNVEIRSNIDHGWNGSNDDSQLQRSRTSSTSSSSSGRSGSSSSSSSSEEKLQLSSTESESGDDESAPVLESAAYSPALEASELTSIVETSASALGVSIACSSPARGLSVVPFNAGRNEDSAPLVEAVRHAIPKELANDGSNTLPVVVISPTEKDSTLDITADKLVCAKHARTVSESGLTLVPAPVDITLTNLEPIHDLHAGGAKSAGIQVDSPSSLGDPALPFQQLVVAKVSKAGCSTTLNLAKNVFKKSDKDVKEGTVQDNSGTVTAKGRLSITSSKKRKCSIQRRSSVIVTTGVEETETQPEPEMDTTFASAVSYLDHFQSVLDFTVVSKDTDVVGTSLEEETHSGNGDSRIIVPTAAGNTPVEINFETEKDGVIFSIQEKKPAETSKIKDSSEEDEAFGLKKRAAQAEAVKDARKSTPTDANCSLAFDTAAIPNEENASSYEASTDCSEITRVHDKLTITEYDSTAPQSINVGFTGFSGLNYALEASARDHVEKSCREVFLEKDVEVMSVREENPTIVPDLHPVKVPPAQGYNIVNIVKVENKEAQQILTNTDSISNTTEGIVPHKEATTEDLESVQETAKNMDISSPEPDISALQAGSISPGSSGQYNYDAEDSNGVDLSSVSIPGEVEQLSEQDVSEDDPHSPSSNTNDETKALPPRYKVAPVERVNTRSLSRGYSRSQSSQDGSISVEPPGETTEAPKRHLVKRRQPVWRDLFPSKISRAKRKKIKLSTAPSTDDTTSDEEVPHRRFSLPTILEESTKLPAPASAGHLVVDPAAEVTVGDEKQDEKPFKRQTVAKQTKIAKKPSAMSNAPIVDPQSHKPKKRGRKPRVPVSVHEGQVVEEGQPVIEAISSAICAKPKLKRALVNWREKDEAIKMAKEREKGSKAIPSTRQKRRKKDAASLGKELNNSMNGEPSSTCSGGVPLINGDTVRMIIEAVVAAAAQHGNLPQPSDDSLPSLLGSDTQESGAGGSTHTSDSAECNRGLSNSSTNGLAQPDVPKIPKKRGRKKLLQDETTETSETECSDRSGRKKMKSDCEHGSDAAAGTSSSRVKRSQRSHKIKGCDCCNGASTKKKGTGLNLKKEQSRVEKLDLLKGDRKIENKNNKEVKSEKKDSISEKEASKVEKGSKSGKEPRPEKDCNIEKDTACKVEKKEVSNVQQKESTTLEKEEPEKCPGNVEKGKKPAPVVTKSQVKLNNNRKR